MGRELMVRQLVVRQQLVLEPVELKMPTRVPKRAIALIGAVLAVGTGCIAMRLVDVSRWTAGDVLVAAALAALVAAAEQFSVRIPFGNETKHVTLTEAAFAAVLLLGVRASVLTAAVAIGFAIGHAVRGTAAHKLAFNVGSCVAAVTASEVAYAALHGVSPVLAVAAAMAAFSAVNASTVVGVIAFASGRTVGAVFAPIARLEALHAVGDLALGMLAASVWGVAPVAVLAAIPASAAIALRYRAKAPPILARASFPSSS
jgi:hypothetical protein